MTRIIAGVAGGRRLESPRGVATRPTADRVREALFSALESRLGTLHGVAFLDLYAGSGAVGLEAWSRGAAAVTLVERDKRTAAVVVRNARALGCDVARVRTAPVAGLLAEPAATAYHVVFSDPPYDRPDASVDEDLAALVTGGWLAPGAVVVVERSTRGQGPHWPAGLDPDGERRYGQTALWYGRGTSQPPGSDPPAHPGVSPCAVPCAPARSTRSPTGTSTSSAAPRSSSTR